MLKIASWIERIVPAARSAANDEPYSTTRRSPRWYQTRCGIRWTSGCAPVAIDERHTGVSDGKVDVARAYSPCSARNRSAGACRSRALSNVDALRPSMTTRTTLRGTVSVPGEDPEPCVPLASAAAKARAERGEGERLEIADERHEGERREHERGQGDEDRRPDARPAALQRPAHELRRPDHARGPTDRAADRLLPVVDQKPDPHSGRGGEDERGREAGPARRE